MAGQTTTKRPARRRKSISDDAVTWGAFLLGLAASLGFSVANAVMTNGVGGSIAVAALWPLLTFCGVKLMMMSRWRKGNVWTLARYGGAGACALISFLINFGHIVRVMAAIGEPDVAAWAAPFAIEMLMLLAGVSLAGNSGRAPVRTRKTPVRRKPQLAAA